MHIKQAHKLLKKYYLVTVLENTRLNIIMLIICSFLERERKNCKVLQFHVNNLSYFESSVTYFEYRPPISAAS